MLSRNVYTIPPRNGPTLRVSRVYPISKTGLPVFRRGFTRFPSSVLSL